jgi:hypothetical protein
MANYRVSLHPITREITKAEKELRKIRLKVGRDDQREIDLDIRDLKKLNKSLILICARPPGHSLTFPPIHMRNCPPPVHMRCPRTVSRRRRKSRSK